MWRRRYLLACSLLVALMVLGAVVSIAAAWPAQFGRQGNPDAVLSEFFSRGTALAPPFVPLLAFAAFAWLARRDDRWGTVGLAVTALLSILFIVGSLGEAFAPPTEDVPRAVLIVSGVVGTLMSALVLVTAVGFYRERAAHGHPSPPDEPIP